MPERFAAFGCGATVFDDGAVQRFYASLPQLGVRVSPGTWFGEESRVFRLGFAHLALPELDAAYDALGGVLAQTAGAIA